MTKLMRAYTPSPLDLAIRSLDEAFDLWPSMFSQGRVTGAWFPMDLVETGEGYQVTAELPGVPKDAIEVSLEGNVLTIRVRKEQAKETEGDSYHLRERVYGEFTRSISLPQDIDPDKVSASQNDGVLTISVAKKASAKPRQIQITSS